MSERLKEQAGFLEGAQIGQISPDIDVKFNSVNVLVGKQGSGKTVTALTEIINCALTGQFHMLVYVNKSGNEVDKTWLSLRDLIKIPVEIIAEEEAVTYIYNIISLKELYYEIRSGFDPNDIDPEQIDLIFSALYVHDFDSPVLNTLILFDDIANNPLFKKQDGELNQLLKRCRHANLVTFLLIQNWSGLLPSIRNEITTLFVFPGFSKQQLNYLYYQSGSALEKEWWFRELNDRDILVVQVSEGGRTYEYNDQDSN
jgi:hypothetical protein